MQGYAVGVAREPTPRGRSSVRTPPGGSVLKGSQLLGSESQGAFDAREAVHRGLPCRKSCNAFALAVLG